MNTFFAVSFIHFQKNPRITRLKKKTKSGRKKKQIRFYYRYLIQERKKKERKTCDNFRIISTCPLTRSFLT